MSKPQEFVYHASWFLPTLFLSVFRCLPVEKLTDQLLQHHRRLGYLDFITLLELGTLRAGLKPDILLPQKAGGQNRGGRVLGKLIAPVDEHGDFGLVGVAVEPDFGHPAHYHAGTLHRRAHLEAADVVELRGKPIDFVHIERAQVPDFQGQDQQSGQPRRDKYSHPQVQRGALHQPSPRNMNAVNTKSSANTASDEVTTVRVVAPDTPSAVGGAS